MERSRAAASLSYGGRQRLRSRRHADVGFLAQLMFSMRFLVQWLASERARRSIVPETFWYFSLFGGALRRLRVSAHRSGVHPRPRHGPLDLRASRSRAHRRRTADGAFAAGVPAE